jgi:nucleoside-diphosphate-sugar epimerase
MNKTNKKVLVSGATGFVGRHLVKYLVEKDFEVYSLARDHKKFLSIKALKGSTFVAFDLKKNNDLSELATDSVLIHCAWEDVRNTQALRHLEEHLMDNYFALKKIIEQGVKKIVVTGTCYEYGLQYGPVTADAPTKPSSAYGLAKDTLHKQLQILQHRLNFELVWARLFYMYGEGQCEKSVVAQFDAAIKSGDKEFKMSFGEQLLDYMRVEEVAKEIANLSAYSDGTYNVCSGSPISLRRLLECRAEELHSSIRLNLGVYDYRSQDSLAIWGAK